MQLRPRHFILLAVILALFAFNIVRYRRARPTAVPPAPAPIFTTAVRANTPAWTAFDHAAGLRDAPDPQFQPALQSLHKQLDAAGSDPSAADIKGCLTWLEFYRQGILHPSRDPQWKDRSQRHLDGCVKFHLDTTISPPS